MAKEMKKVEETSSRNSFADYVKQLFYALRRMSVEPAGFFLMSCSLMNYLMSQDLILDRACRVNLHSQISTEICHNITNNVGRENYEDEEIAIQMVVSKVRTYRSIIDHSIPILYVIYLGPWSDRYGRKLPMMLPPIGNLLQSIAFMVFTLTESVDAYTIGIVAAIMTSFTGGLTTFSMSALSHIADTTTDQMRTIRTGLFQSCFNIGVPVGFAIGGALSKSYLSNTTSFGISAAFAVMSFLIVLVSVKNVKRSDGQSDSTYKMNHCINTMQVFRTPFKKRSNNGRLKIILLLIAFLCIAAPIHGEFGVMYLFLRHNLQWDAGDYGKFSTYNSIVAVAGTILSMGILSHALKLSDPVVGFLSGISQLVGCFIYAFATTVLMIYLAPAVDMMNGTMAVVSKSMLSKFVETDELGKIFSFVSILESVAPLLSDPTYSTLYRHSINFFAGSFFILSAALTVPPQIIFLLFIYKKWAVRTQTTKHESITSTGNGKSAISDDAMGPAISTTTVNTLDC